MTQRKEWILGQKESHIQSSVFSSKLALSPSPSAGSTLVTKLHCYIWAFIDVKAYFDILKRCGKNYVTVARDALCRGLLFLQSSALSCHWGDFLSILAKLVYVSLLLLFQHCSGGCFLKNAIPIYFWKFNKLFSGLSSACLQFSFAFSLKEIGTDFTSIQFH